MFVNRKQLMRAELEDNMLGILCVTFLDNKRLLRLIISIFCSFYVGFKLNLTFGFKKCPECYGTELCRFFQNHQIQLTWFSYFLSILNPNLTKSVFHGVFNESRAIVIKRKALRSRKFPSEVEFKGILRKVRLDEKRIQNVILCPGVENLDFLFNEIEGISGKRLWSDVSTSIGPLLMKYFEHQNEWPVPKYYGACGDATIEEYKGEPLINFLSFKFKSRVFLAVQLLKMAHLFTFEDPKFIFYFTDYSLYNFVVDSNGNVSLVDLDNVIIYNRTANQESSIHSSEAPDEDEYIFSPSDICSYHLSDHNYFFICQYLLMHFKEGLLNEIPQEVLEDNPNLLELLAECVKPNLNRSRIYAGQKLQVVLEEIIKDYIWNS